MRARSSPTPRRRTTTPGPRHYRACSPTTRLGAPDAKKAKQGRSIPKPSISKPNVSLSKPSLSKTQADAVAVAVAEASEPEETEEAEMETADFNKDNKAPAEPPSLPPAIETKESCSAFFIEQNSTDPGVDQGGSQGQRGLPA